MRCVFLLFGDRGGKSCGGPAPYLSSSHQYKHLIDILLRLDSDDFFCGHIPFSETILRLLSQSDVCIIQALRDPRDVLVSQLSFALEHSQHFLHHTLKDINNPTEQQRLVLQGSIDGRLLQKSLVDQYREIDRWMSSGKILVVRYEDLVGEQGDGDLARQKETVEQIACFLGISISRSRVNNICELLYDPNTPGFGMGKIGRWVDVLTPEFLDLFNSDMIITMKRWGYA